jgi:hypothetical protein
MLSPKYYFHRIDKVLMKDGIYMIKPWFSYVREMADRPDER